MLWSPKCHHAKVAYNITFEQLVAAVKSDLLEARVDRMGYVYHPAGFTRH
jgi:hypothetical protein